VESSGWPRFPEPAYYAFAMPAPANFSSAAVAPAAAHWVPSMGEFLLPYEAVRASADPRATLLDYFQS